MSASESYVCVCACVFEHVGIGVCLPHGNGVFKSRTFLTWPGVVGVCVALRDRTAPPSQLATVAH